MGSEVEEGSCGGTQVFDAELAIQEPGPCCRNVRGTGGVSPPARPPTHPPGLKSMQADKSLRAKPQIVLEIIKLLDADRHVCNPRNSHLAVPHNARTARRQCQSSPTSPSAQAAATMTPHQPTTNLTKHNASKWSLSQTWRPPPSIQSSSSPTASPTWPSSST